jgi:hypothetical protein
MVGFFSRNQAGGSSKEGLRAVLHLTVLRELSLQLNTDQKGTDSYMKAQHQVAVAQACMMQLTQMKQLTALKMDSSIHNDLKDVSLVCKVVKGAFLVCIPRQWLCGMAHAHA